MSSEEEQKTEEKKKEKINVVTLRNYSKVIFFYPLFFASLVLWILQLIYGDPVALFGFIWMIFFATNLFVVAFDFGSTKFFILLLAIVIVALLVIFLVLPNIEIGGIPAPGEFNIEMTSQFYLIVTLIIGFILLFIIIAARFNYWKIERNEIYHKTGLLADAERYPVQNLRIKKEITDVFEFLVLRSGAITLYTGKGDDFHLATVPNVNTKIENLNYLLSHLEVEIDELDKQ
ncbi:MAG: conserved membrane protein of unknown function [Promethearchaeota archaeon]|nr:MAG: conserved membrane protein of unknown function [Candidatus Lokiarchaeota archaeon]